MLDLPWASSPGPTARPIAGDSPGACSRNSVPSTSYPPRLVGTPDHAWTSPSYSEGIDNADPVHLSAALRNGSIGFSFSGGGFLLPYYVGSIRTLAHLGLLRPGVTHVGGSSAGALAAAIVSCGIETVAVLDSIRALILDSRESGVYKRLGAMVREQLEAVLPPDAHTRCSGTTHIGISKVKAYGSLRSKRVSHFSSRQDLIEALLASTYIPLLSDGKLMTRFRGRRVVDGSVTDLMPVPPQPLHVVKISCLPLANIERMVMRNKELALRHISVSASAFRDWPHSRMETLRFIFRPGPDDFLDFLLEAGSQDVVTWAQAGGLLTSAPPLPILKLSGESPVEIDTDPSDQRTLDFGDNVAAADMDPEKKLRQLCSCDNECDPVSSFSSPSPSARLMACF